MVEGVISAMKAQNVDKIKFWVSSPTTFINFQKSKVPMQQIFLSGSAGKIETAAETGCMGIPWYWDAAYPNDTTALGINPEYVKLYTKGRAMSFSKPMDVVDQWFTAWKMKLRMQVMFLNLKRQLIVTSLSA